MIAASLPASITPLCFREGLRLRLLVAACCLDWPCRAGTFLHDPCLTTFTHRNPVINSSSLLHLGTRIIQIPFFIPTTTPPRLLPPIAAMSAELALGTPLADALNTAIQNKIADYGWASGSSEGAAMSEYFILMLANGKTENDISSEIAGELLGLGPDDQTAPAFARWLVEQYQVLSSQIAIAGANGASGNTSQDDAMDATFDNGVDMTTDSPAGELNAYVLS